MTRPLDRDRLMPSCCCVGEAGVYGDLGTNSPPRRGYAAAFPAWGCYLTRSFLVEWVCVKFSVTFFCLLIGYYFSRNLLGLLKFT